jgi:hypothetical protein
MSHFLPGFSIFVWIGLGLLFLVLVGTMTWTTWISCRLRKVNAPKLRFLLAGAVLQILLGGLAVFLVRTIKNDPAISIGTGLGISILSGLFFIKVNLKLGWKQSLRIWRISAGLQLVLVPVCSTILTVGWLMLTFTLFPPQL